MTRNVGGLDRIIRIVLGILLIAAPFIGIVAGTTASTISVIIGLVLLVTGATQMCPLYKALGIDTKRT